MTRKLAYQLFASHPMIDKEQDKRLYLSGLFQWIAAFEKHGRFGRADARIDKEILEECDIIGVNVIPGGMSYLAALREELGKSDTKIVANVDFGTMMWNMIDPLVLKQQLKCADMIFHVESNGAERLRRLTGREVKVIPHPVNIEDIKEGVKEKDERVANTITCQYHRYSDTWCEYYYGLQSTKKNMNAKVFLMNYSYENEKDRRVPVIGMFNELVHRIPYRDYLRLLSTTTINVDVTHDYTYGRGVVEAAALKVPTICSETIEASKLWEGLTSIKTGKDREMDDAATVLLRDDELWEALAKMGYKNSDQYSLKKSYERMCRAVEEEK